MRKEIIATKIQVAKQGAQVYFTITLPKDASFIEKVETGVLGFSTMLLVGSLPIPAGSQPGAAPVINQVSGNLAGTLQLQGMEKPNLCYATDIVLGNSSLDNVLFGFTDDITNDQTLAFTILPFVAAHKQVWERVRLVNNYMLYGYYRDEIGLQSGADIIYTVGLYLHLVINN